MAFSFFKKQMILSILLLYISFYGFGLGRAQTGIAGSGIGYIPQPGSGAGGRGFGTIGSGGFGIGGIGGRGISDALGCFNNKIYSGCEESHRVTESGDLHVPPDFTDQFCSGPCLKETDLVLNCINDVFSTFLFNNRATVRNLKDTIKAGCSYGPTRGDFNVAERIGAYGSNSYKFSCSIIFLLVPLISICVLLF